MSGSPAELDQLIDICRSAARPELDLVVAGEGNASLTTEDGRLYVTATGSRLGSLTTDDLVAVDRSKIIDGLRATTDDQGWRQVVASCSSDGRPTVEVGIHAVLSAALGPGIILHTHPTAVLACMANGRGPDLAEKRFLPDHVVLCGTSSWDLPYIDPGRELAATVLTSVEAGVDVPAVIFLRHHGVLVNAPQSRSALDITLMVAKAARILSSCDGTVSAMAGTDIARIADREDEQNRRRVLGLERATSPDLGGRP